MAVPYNNTHSLKKFYLNDKTHNYTVLILEEQTIYIEYNREIQTKVVWTYEEDQMYRMPGAMHAMVLKETRSRDRVTKRMEEGMRRKEDWNRDGMEMERWEAYSLTKKFI